jgi:hypothetical protein
MLKSWIEWKEVCALNLCTETTQSRLLAFADIRFRKYTAHYSHLVNTHAGRSLPSVPAQNAWHLFETHMAVTTTKQGKRYKDWLFARLRASDEMPLDTVQGGASLIMRNVVREFLRQEFSPGNTLSLNQPLHGSKNATLTLEDVLPGDMDPASHAALHEYEELARKHAEAIFPKLSRRERVAVLSKEIGLSLAHKAVETAAGCRKSVLNTAYKSIMKTVAKILQERYPDDEKQSILTLALLTVGEIKEHVLAWARSEACCGPLFVMARRRTTLK